jgi:hypothetical protein
VREVTQDTRDELARAHRVVITDKIREREQGLLSAGRMTRQAVPRVRDTLMLSGRELSTIQKHERAVRMHLVLGPGRIKLAKLTPMHVQPYIRDKLGRCDGPRDAAAVAEHAADGAQTGRGVGACSSVRCSRRRTPIRAVFEPGEDHRHGAAPNRFLTHLAMLEVDDGGSPATWGDHVTDDEYAAAPPIDA